MDLNVCDVSDEFEPRAVPRPAPRFDSPPVPSVPEVSLVFDNPQGTRNHENKAPCSPSMDKYESYAAWKAKKCSIVADGRSTRIGSSYDAYSGEPSGKIERSNSQNDASSQQNNAIINESLKHSKSDSSLTDRIESLDYLQDANNERMLKAMQERERNFSSNQRYVPNVSRSQERERRYHTPTRSPSVRNNSKRIDNIEETSPHNDGRLYVRYPNSNVEAQYPDFGSANSNLHPRYPVSDSRSPGFSAKYSSPNPANLQHRNLTPRSPAGPRFQNYPQNVCPRYQYPPCFEADYQYPFPYSYYPSSQSQKSESEETVKNLLQLVNNQSEQIKSLQSQVERLLKIQEESLKDRAKCKCLHEPPFRNTQQNMQLCFQDTDSDQINVPKIFQDDSRPPRHNNTMERNMIQNSSKIQEITKNITTDYNSQACDNRMNLPLLDEQMKNKILEQKVSIGVMTSFEFTVQNNPLASEVDEQHKFYDQNSAKNGDYPGSDMNEPVANQSSGKNQSPFSRVSNMPLENIIEDSESHISSSRQPSSNFHPSPTADELPDIKPSSRRPVFDSGKRSENIHRSQSPRMFDNTLGTRDSADNDVQRQKYLENKSHRCLGNLCLESNAANSNRRPAIHNSESPARNTDREKFYDWSESARNERFENMHDLSAKRPDNRDVAQNGHHSSKEFTRSRTKEPVNYMDEKNGKPFSESNSRDHYIEDSIVLSTGGLEIKDRAPPSPEPSIHVDMQEYFSDEDSDKQGSGNKQTPKVGWTFYNNVLGQVNQILQSSPMALSGKDRTSEGDDGIGTKKNIQNEDADKATMDAVKIATMEQLKKLGISFVENAESKETMENKKVTFDSSFYPRLEYRGNMAQATSVISETDTSMKMNALALKYLSDEQLGDLALQKHGAGTLKHLMVSNVQGTNLSFATMRYLERYQLVPGKNGSQLDELGKQNLEVPRIQELKNPTQTRSPRSNRGPPPPTQTTRMSYPSKILDISTLKQQPKLL